MSRTFVPPGGDSRPGSPAALRPRRTTALAALFASVAAVAVLPGTTARAADTAVTVDFATTSGAPTYRASGTIYGMTPDASAPQDHFYRDIKWNLMRAGGAQLNSGGYATSLADYQTRWNATLAQYKRTAALGGTFVLLPHDLWGADGTTSQGWPGDNGDWTQFDAFVTRLINDVKANNMTVEWDLWNEPDGSNFWAPPQTQYLQMWARFHAKVRAAFPNQLIVGPSIANRPSSSNTWWTNYLAYVKANNVAPDIYSWHELPGDPVTDVGRADSTLAAAGLTNTRPYQVNEYALPGEQNPGSGSWYISRLERAGVDGLRANWASGTNLHDYQAALLTKNSAGQYLPRGEWFSYRYYGSQTGSVVGVTPGTGTDGFATKDNSAKNAKILLGSNGNTGTVTVNLTGLNTTSVVEGGQVRAVVQRNPYDNGNAVSGPTTVSDTTLTVSGNAASLTVPWTNAKDAYTVTLLPPSNTTISTIAISPNSRQCLDDTNLSKANGTQYQQYYCEGGYQQMFDFKPVTGRANTYTVVNQHSGKCLDVMNASTADDAAVIQYTCNGGTHQMFTLNPVTALGGTRDYQLVAVHSGKCVDVTGVSTAARALIHQWTCDSASALSTKKNQIWTLLGKS
ncbi:RICIN domain-containing protein [Streptomyces spongiae]|uniref:RICIN domain-containing protein n=1 Tax=Streptomyces spongiae TaxID=565072 RepID=A0A5N8XMU4_9ACTN|nr:RICIN domain-containing protein [Streptomyces spongiae]MPY60614.1 RICIN domain-containing protein [Streptomyces spongiae]